jgi:hypothetical protein
MRIKIAAILLAACSCAFTHGFGQITGVPPHPSVRLPDGEGSWTVLYTPRITVAPKPGEKPVPPDPNALKAIYSVVDGGLRRDRLVWNSDKTTDIWKMDNQWYFKDDANQRIASMTVFPGAQIYDGWKSLDRALIQHVVNSGTGTLTAYNQIPALLFTEIRNGAPTSYMTAAVGPGEKPVVEKSPMGVFLNPQTFQPIAYVDADGSYYFKSITETPPERLVPPPDFEAELQLAHAAAYVPAAPQHP